MFFTTLASRELKARVDALVAALRANPPAKPSSRASPPVMRRCAATRLEQARADLAAVGVAALHDNPHDLVRAVAQAVHGQAIRARSPRGA